MLDGHVVGVRNVLHVPSLRVPLYSLRAHRQMDGCGFIGDNDRFHVYFPSFVAMVDDAIDSHIHYAATWSDISNFRMSSASHASQSSTCIGSRQTSSPQPATVIPFSPSEIAPTSIFSDEDFPPLPRSGYPIGVQAPDRLPLSGHRLRHLSLTHTAVPKAPSTSVPTVPPSSTSTTPASSATPIRIITPKRISQAALRAFLPDGASAPPPIRPCDTPNGSDTTRASHGRQDLSAVWPPSFSKLPEFLLYIEGLEVH